jgi:hypothetical protein
MKLEKEEKVHENLCGFFFMAAKIDIKEVNVTQFERKILNRLVMQFMIFPGCCQDEFSRNPSAL